MAKEKRTKPCSNCKKSKVKCIYSNTLPCERCIKGGQAANCQFVPKLPSLKLPEITPQHSNSVKSENDITLPPLNPMANVSANQVNRIPQTYMMHTVPQQNIPVVPTNGAGQQDINDMQWKQQMENRINTFDNKLSDLVDILKSNQKVLLDQQMAYQKIPYQQPQQNALQDSAYFYGSQLSSVSQSPSSLYQREPASHYNQYNQYNRIASNDSESRRQDINEDLGRAVLRKRQKREDDLGSAKHGKPEDFRDGFLSIQQARELFRFFDAHISPQLFGFEISKLTVDSLWDSSPILICAICTIASMHHPQQELSTKLKQLHNYLHGFCGKLLYQGRPTNEIDGFNTIVALVLCSFWLSDSQMFTGLALQLAKEIGLDSPVSNNSRKGDLKEKDRLKLWYLLYVLDGQQSLTFNRQPLVNSQEYSLKNSRAILLNDGNLSLPSPTPQLEDKNGTSLVKTERKARDKDEDVKIHEAAHKQRITDMRLVSQVEYNQALNEAFKGNAWELLAPSALGIPSKSNLELDKWMVSWTVLLSPVSSGSVWSSKSTLIYYNFAKMHINSSAVRLLQMDTTNDKNMFPKWNQSLRPEMPQKKKILPLNNELDSEEESDEEEFISNKDHISDDETTVSASIAVNAAQTVLNLVLNDNDILNNLKYVPVHIHIMLYYAALLLLNPPHTDNAWNGPQPKDRFNKILSNLRIVKLLQKKIYANLPTDKAFGNKLIQSLNEIVEENSMKIGDEINNTSDIDEVVKTELRNRLKVLESMESSGILELAEGGYDSTSSGSPTPGPEKIFAWPGSNHGHP